MCANRSTDASYCDLKQEYVIGSAGMVVLFPEPANQKAEAIMKSAGMTLAEYSSRQFDQEDIQEDSLVLAIDERSPQNTAG